MAKNKPKYTAPSPDEFSKVSDKLSEKEEWLDIDEWQMSVLLRPASFGDYLAIVRDTQFQREKNPAHAELYGMLAWVRACLVEPKMSPDQIEKLAHADTSVMLRLSNKCQELSFNLPDQFNVDVDEAKNDSEAEVDTGESIPPVSSDSESLPDKPDSPTPSSLS